MSSGGYQEYSGNPYGGSGGYGSQQAGYGASNPYGQEEKPSAQQETAPYSEGSRYDGPGEQNPAFAPMPSQPLSNQDFLTRVEGVKAEIRNLTGNIGEIGAIHQRALSSTEGGSNAQLDHIIADTQVLNTRIKDQIKALEKDAAKSGKNQTKDSQIRTLKGNFESQLREYRAEEQAYRQRYRDQIARQYKIVNPEASDQEVREAADANWGDEGVFQTALKSNRSGAAQSVLGSVRARHNDIVQIEKTLIELDQLFRDLAEAVVLQEPAVAAAEEQTGNVLTDTTEGNKHLTKGVKSARRARKLKWWCFFIVVLIIAILALVLGLVFGLRNN